MKNMKYFVVTPDGSYNKIPRLKNWQDQQMFEEILEKPYYDTKDRFIMDIEPKKQVTCPDILEHPVFMISDEAKKVCELFEPNLRWKEVILCGAFVEIKQDLYHIPLLNPVDCLSNEYQLHGRNGEEEEIKLVREKIGEHALLQVAGTRKPTYIMRLDLVEALLRRDIFGIALKEAVLRDN